MHPTSNGRPCVCYSTMVVEACFDQPALLNAGLTDQCTLELKDLTPSDSKLIGFSIPKGSQMSLSISMRSRGGVAEM
jgi:hypothetical protein